MSVTIAARINILQQMSVHELQDEYCKVCGEKTTAAHKSFLVKKIAWKIQESEFGGISGQVRQKALEMVENLKLPGIIPSLNLKEAPSVKIQSPLQDKRLPLPGTIITKEYKGKQITVQVLQDGFEYAGCKYRSLSALAKAITGSHCNGFAFFGLGR